MKNKSNSTSQKMGKSLQLILIGLLLATCQPISVLKKSEDIKTSTIPPKKIVKATSIVESNILFLNHPFLDTEFGGLKRLLNVSAIQVDTANKLISVQFNRFFSFIAFREENTAEFYRIYQSLLPDSYKSWNVSLMTMKEPIEQLIPNSYRISTPKDSTRLALKSSNRQKPIVRPAKRPYQITNGLVNHPIALWPSHGWYYNFAEDRWMWQRARLFGTVEDLYPMSITMPYLIPMLENAGSNVFTPRERDTQLNEVVVDNNGSDGKSKYIENGNWTTGSTTGFAIGNRPYKENLNPFKTGTYKEIKSDLKGQFQAGWVPEIPEDGEYAVYISYNASAQNSSDVSYTVHHAGGETEFFVNQKIGGSTWIYLGTFSFKKGYLPNDQKVVLSSKTLKPGERISADAVRFGGGMGLIERNGRVSERPKYVEGSRYWLQYAGFPDTLTYALNDSNDYNDDYQSRGEWVNYLMGAPNGPNKKRDVQGLGIPIDVSLAFHTDAGITGTDRTIGTLMIYSAADDDSVRQFPNGNSRLANRDLGDLMQTQLVTDLRLKYDSTWSRRSLQNARYSESLRPNTPAVLLELLSHQNFSDMKHGLDPTYKFDVARSIYKSMLKFVANQYGYDYIVQPLPVSHLSVKFTDKGQFEVNWNEVIDTLESTSKANAYMIYIREDEGVFDSGRLVETPSFLLEKPKKGVLYSFKVEAVNKGGKSMPSEIVSAGLAEKGKSPVLVINGFTRISGPSFVSSGNFEGFTHFDDRGVPDKNDVAFVGDQYNFDKSFKWNTDDEPGHGASYANYETQVIAGNTFDFAAVHGRSILNAGYTFVSSSLQAVMENHIDITAFKYVDLILGEQKATSRTRSGYDEKYGRLFEAYPQKLQSKLKFYAQSGGNLFISGAYVTSDTYRNPVPDSALVSLSENTFHVKHRTNHASVSGQVFATDSKLISLPDKFSFNTQLNSRIYQVESPDAIEPSTKEGKIIARYKENGFSAATLFEGYYKTVVFGFPFETIIESKDRDQLMKAVLQFFDKTLK